MVDTETIPTQNDGGSSPRGRIGAIVVAIVAGVGIIAVLGWVTAQLVAGSGDWDVEAGQPVEVTIAPGSTARTIYAELEAVGVARSEELQSAARQLGVEDRLRAGAYSLTTGMDAQVVVEQLVDGPNADGGATFTVVEGWTVDRIVEALAEVTPYSQGELQRVLRSGEVTSTYLPEVGGPIDSLNRWEGLLYPATYQLTDAMTAVDILGAMADEASRRLDTANWSRLDALGVTRHEALVIASLVEREAGTDDERDLIASVIYNRLDEPMRLQIDASVIYALGYNPGRVTAEHLAVESPWNTYRVDGLPPTPIGAASAASLAAAVDPAESTYLFYVLGSADGSHLFAETYEGHQENIAKAKADGVLP